MGGVRGRTYEVNGDWFAEWQNVITDGTFSIELESPTQAPRRSRGRTSLRTDYCPGRAKAHGGQAFVFPFGITALTAESRERLFLAVLPAPFGPGLSTDACVRLAERMGAQIEAAGARLISDPKEIPAMEDRRYPI